MANILGRLSADALWFASYALTNVDISLRGNGANDGRASGNISRSAARFVTARIDDTAISDVHPGQQVDITVDAYPDITLIGYVREIQAALLECCPPSCRTTPPDASRNSRRWFQ